MKIAFIYNLNRGQFDYEAEFDQPATVNALKKVLRQLGKVKCIESDRNYGKWISTLVNYKPDIIFSIAEGYSGSSREAFYPALYDQLGYKYAGPDASNLLIFQNKYLTKKLGEMAGIMVPKGFLMSEPHSYFCKKNKVEYPLIIKPNFEGSSIGILPASVVKNERELLKQIRIFFKKYDKTAIIEEFIEGIDVSMVYIEGIGALGPAVINYQGKNIYDWKLKTVDDETVDIVEGQFLQKALKSRLIEIVAKLSLVFDIKGYAKIDFRIDKKGEVYLLELNGQVSFHPKGEFVVAAEASGYSFEKVVSHILRYSIKHHQKRHGEITINQ